MPFTHCEPCYDTYNIRPLPSRRLLVCGMFASMLLAGLSCGIGVLLLVIPEALSEPWKPYAWIAIVATLLISVAGGISAYQRYDHIYCRVSQGKVVHFSSKYVGGRLSGLGWTEFHVTLSGNSYANERSLYRWVIGIGDVPADKDIREGDYLRWRPDMYESSGYIIG